MAGPGEDEAVGEGMTMDWPVPLHQCCPVGPLPFLWDGTAFSDWGDAEFSEGFLDDTLSTGKEDRPEDVPVSVPGEDKLVTTLLGIGHGSVCAGVPDMDGTGVLPLEMGTGKLGLVPAQPGVGATTAEVRACELHGNTADAAKAKTGKDVRKPRKAYAMTEKMEAVDGLGVPADHGSRYKTAAGYAALQQETIARRKVVAVKHAATLAKEVCQRLIGQDLPQGLGPVPKGHGSLYKTSNSARTAAYKRARDAGEPKKAAKERGARARTEWNNGYKMREAIASWGK